MFAPDGLGSFSIDAGVLTYALAALAYCGLALLMATSWRGRLQGGLLLLVCGVSVIWAGLLVVHAGYGHPNSSLIFIVELIRDGLWLFFILRLLSPVENSSESIKSKLQLTAYALWVFLAVLISAYLWEWWGGVGLGTNAGLMGYLALSILGLVLIEQLFRNAHPQQRWAIKFLCLGVGGSFAYDFYLYSDAVLFGRLDAGLWDARGIIQVLIVPLIGISAARNPQWSLDIFVSRKIVFHTVTIVAAGSYLLVMAVGGYFIRYWGGEWGTIAQIIFLFGAIVMLLVLLFSGQIRAQFRVFLSKNFFSYKYDYRQEWLNLTERLSSETQESKLQEQVIQALASFVDSDKGLLWLKNENGNYELQGYWNAPEMKINVSPSDSMVAFLSDSKWIVDLDEYAAEPELYEKLVLPEWLKELSLAWLVLPLIQHDKLFGFVILGRPNVAGSLNWEDRDLLKTAGSQAAGYLALVKTSEALVDARQFEAFNRLSAYVVHDLKNVAGQLSLVVENSKKHRDNPVFIDDVFSTIENAVGKMQRMLGQLRAGRSPVTSMMSIKLGVVLDEVVANRMCQKPSPVLIKNGDLTVMADRDRLLDVLEHVVSNAQEATPDDGRVEIRLEQFDKNAVIEVEDTGCGMDYQFIKERLFRPFDTTKGNAGMGIGVYECREFIRSIGGDVEVDSLLGKGTSFRLIIPLADR